jgi:hypothetical protein
MKTIPLLTTCSILLLSPQVLSQETLQGGSGGGGDMGNIEVDVPCEGEEDSPRPNETNDDHNPNGSADEASGGSDETVSPNHFDGSMTLDVGAFLRGWTLPTVAFKDSSESTSLIIIIDEPDKDNNGPDWSVPAREWRVPSSEKISYRPVDPVEKFRNRINSQDKVNSGTRPRIVMRGKDYPSCPNSGGNDEPRETVIQYSTCDCCCHESSSNGPRITTSSESWDDDYEGNAYSQSEDDKEEVDRYGGKRCESSDDENYEDNNSLGQTFTYSDYDECECRCTCQKPFDIVMYD